MQKAVRFIRKNGKVIPIAAAAAGTATRKVGTLARPLRTAASAGAAGAVKKQSEIKVNRSLDLAGLGLSVASGALAAATFSGGAKGILGGAVGSHALDALGITANVASVAGRGNQKARIKQAARQEGRNFLIGNTIFAAGVVGLKSNRKALASYASTVLALGRKALRVA